MPPRFAYWTIILEGKPTAFRAQHREDLLPTFKQLQGKHPDAVMMWFGRGRLWASPEDARAADRTRLDRRKPDWRPGGEHRDPRARFKVPRDEKRRRFAANLRRDWRDQRPRASGSPDEQVPPRRDEDLRGDRPINRGQRPPFKTRDDRERRPWKPGGQKPFHDRDRDGQERPEWKPPGSRPAKPAWGARKPGARGPRLEDGNRGEPGREQRGPGGKPQSFRPKGPGHRDSSGGPHRFRPKGGRDDRGRGPKSRGPGGGGGGGGHSR